MADEKLYHWSDGDGAYPTETWCGIPFMVEPEGAGPDAAIDKASGMATNPVLGRYLEFVLSDDCGGVGARAVTCPTCMAALVENQLLDDDD